MKYIISFLFVFSNLTIFGQFYTSSQFSFTSIQSVENYKTNIPLESTLSFELGYRLKKYSFDLLITDTEYRVFDNSTPVNFLTEYGLLFSGIQTSQLSPNN
ncbi:hypothetical protein [Portibacter lacus]|uniref:hypothetical protein n=1 Tax=Portibacter lacus TaxID=1099794 RepID=UPI001F266FD3|nr:hypothetical protein [Portibacter lacus]